MLGQREYQKANYLTRIFYYSVTQQGIITMLSMRNNIANQHTTYRVAGVSYLALLLLLLPMQIAAQAQPSLEATAIDKTIRSNAMPGKAGEILGGLKKWMGPYQRLREEGDSSYSVIFDRSSLPIELSGGLIGGKLGVGCPITKLSLSSAPSNVKETFSKCPNLKP
jgi:hypothetical protein